ncbi:MAG: Glu-tRNA(Gln) amidotransferase subunit GatE [Candidatus Micrarchaeaceae archaeon]
MEDAKYYKSIGFRCGLEIHQRLLTRSKLFCGCDATIPSSMRIASVERRQRAVAGELGKIDRSTFFESERNRSFLYNLFEKSTCLVDIDEEPPHELNREALEIAMLIAASFNAKIPDEIEPMRKEVVDGSDPSAFQRTLLIGYGGEMAINGKKIGIEGIFLEEESGGIEKSDATSVSYNLDRFGIPLVEIDTAPVISTPEEAKAVALSIGTLLRLTSKVQRGIGTIRQDVNISITGGARVEIKGFQDLGIMDAVIRNEVERQMKLIEISNALKNASAEVGKPVDVTDLFHGTESHIISHAVMRGGSVFAARLRGFKGMLGREINKGRRLGSEISDYAKAAGVGGIIHSDEDLRAYGISSDEISKLEEALRIGNGDAFIIVAAEGGAAKRAIDLALGRAVSAIEGVPPETRAVDQASMQTRFLRLLPGGSRMYPETDVKPIETDLAYYKRLLKTAPKIEESRRELLEQIKNGQLAEQMLRSPMLQTYRSIIGEVDVEPQIVAAVLLEKFKELGRAGIDVNSIPVEVLSYIFSKYAAKKITKLGIGEILKALPKSADDVDKTINEKGLKRISGNALVALVKRFHAGSKEALAKEIMSKYRLVVDGSELNDILRKVV